MKGRSDVPARPFSDVVAVLFSENVRSMILQAARQLQPSCQRPNLVVTHVVYGPDTVATR